MKKILLNRVHAHLVKQGWKLNKDGGSSQSVDYYRKSKVFNIDDSLLVYHNVGIVRSIAGEWGVEPKNESDAGVRRKTWKPVDYKKAGLKNAR